MQDGWAVVCNPNPEDRLYLRPGAGNRDDSLGKYYNAEIVRRLMEDELSIFMTDAWVEEMGLQNIAAFQTFPQFFVLASDSMDRPGNDFKGRPFPGR